MHIEYITRADLTHMLRVQRAAVVALEEVQKRAAEGCRSCARFHQVRHWCDHWSATVPPEAHRDGCDQWVADPIPF